MCCSDLRLGQEWLASCVTANSVIDLWQVLFTYRSGDSVYPSPDGMDFSSMMSSLSLWSSEP